MTHEFQVQTVKELAIVIPAIKKNVAFADDLVKKMQGVTLIQRSINKAKELGSASDIYVVTDSEEIGLICKRNAIKCFYDQELRLQELDIVSELHYFLLKIHKKYENLIIIYPYSPTISENVIRKAYNYFLENHFNVLIPVKEVKHRIFSEENSNLMEIISLYNKEKLLVEVKAFLIMRSSLVKNYQGKIQIGKYLLGEHTVEIRNYQDWWICEKLLKRKRIVFRVIGYPEVGTGHIFRSLALAHEITDHEIIFVCDQRSRLAVNQIAGADYLVEVHPPETITDAIIRQRPDLVINDILDTTRDYILKLKDIGARVVNFEDLGTGAACSDITFNALYDQPILDAKNIRWGEGYFFLRDEFIGAKPRSFRDPVQSVLITFGGTDPNNLTLTTLGAIADFCKVRNISIYVVTGGGYPYKNEMTDFIDRLNYEKIEFTFATGVMSGIMENADLAISSNGRTVLELAHMNIPSLVISQHDREATHRFACQDNGVINLGLYDPATIREVICRNLELLVNDQVRRKKLYDRMKRFNFLQNKRRVLSLIEEQLT